MKSFRATRRCRSANTSPQKADGRTAGRPSPSPLPSSLPSPGHPIVAADCDPPCSSAPAVRLLGTAGQRAGSGQHPQPAASSIATSSAQSGSGRRGRNQEKCTCLQLFPELLLGTFLLLAAGLGLQVSQELGPQLRGPAGGAGRADKPGGGVGGVCTMRASIGQVVQL